MKACPACIYAQTINNQPRNQLKWSGPSNKTEYRYTNIIMLLKKYNTNEHISTTAALIDTLRLISASSNFSIHRSTLYIM